MEFHLKFIQLALKIFKKKIYMCKKIIFPFYTLTIYNTY